MLARRARSTVTPYSLLAAKIRDWVPPQGTALQSYDARTGILKITFEVVLSCQCEAEETLLLRSMISRDLWDDSKVYRDVIVQGVLTRMFEEAEQKMVEHIGVRT